MEPRQPGAQNILLLSREGFLSSEPAAEDTTTTTTTSSSSSNDESGGADGAAEGGSTGSGSLEAVLRVTDVLLCPEEACVTEWTSEDAADVGFKGQVGWGLG
jgi:hypothetical protein